jgi:flagellar protein FlaG
MEVNDNQNTAGIKQLILPSPSLPLRGERQSPHPDVNANHIGKEMEAKVAIGAESNKEGELEELRKTLEEINESLKMKNIALNYSIDDKTEEIVVKVIEKSSDRVIRQILPEEALRLRGHIEELLGMIFDENIMIGQWSP